MHPLWIWGGAAVLYAAFSYWYSNWGGRAAQPR